MPQLPKLIKALLEPKAYSHPPQRIELVQTQMSFVFMTDDYVYKVKKAVNLGYLDYTTLKKRQLYCHKEVKLNQRLCPEVYLGVIPISRKKGIIRLEGQGKTIEYAVKMRRLPQEAMLNVLLKKNQVSAEMINRVAQKLVTFHYKAETTASISTFGRLDAIRENTEENFTQTKKYVDSTITQEAYQHLKDYTNSFLAKKAYLFRRRMANGKIKDCHGDLHAAHICFTNGICIYDCIEFNDRFRYCDVASEVAFLAMDLDHYGQSDLSGSFVNDYVKGSQDEELKELLNFYKCYRAYVRGKVESFKLDDPYITEEEKTKVLTIARSYFDLAESYI